MKFFIEIIKKYFNQKKLIFNGCNVRNIRCEDSYSIISLGDGLSYYKFDYCSNKEFFTALIKISGIKCKIIYNCNLTKQIKKDLLQCEMEDVQSIIHLLKSEEINLPLSLVFDLSFLLYLKEK